MLVSYEKFNYAINEGFNTYKKYIYIYPNKINTFRKSINKKKKKNEKNVR